MHGSEIQSPDSFSAGGGKAGPFPGCWGAGKTPGRRVSAAGQRGLCRAGRQHLPARGCGPGESHPASLRAPRGAPGAAGTCLGPVRLPEPQFSRLSSGKSDSHPPVSAEYSLAAEQRRERGPRERCSVGGALAGPVCPHWGWRAGPLGDRNPAATRPGGSPPPGSLSATAPPADRPGAGSEMTPPREGCPASPVGWPLQHPHLPWPPGAHWTRTPWKAGWACSAHAPGPRQRLRVC